MSPDDTTDVAEPWPNASQERAVRDQAARGNPDAQCAEVSLFCDALTEALVDGPKDWSEE